MRISDWSSDVCSSDLEDLPAPKFVNDDPRHLAGVDDGLCDRDRECDNFVESLAVENPEPVRSSDFNEMFATGLEIGRASCRERVCQYVEISVVAGSLKKKSES